PISRPLHILGCPSRTVYIRTDGSFISLLEKICGALSLSGALTAGRGVMKSGSISSYFSRRVSVVCLTLMPLAQT
ncbi:UPF0329 protein, partial [Dissostichus eleginoides]